MEQWNSTNPNYITPAHNPNSQPESTLFSQHVTRTTAEDPDRYMRYAKLLFTFIAAIVFVLFLSGSSEPEPETVDGKPNYHQFFGLK